MIRRVLPSYCLFVAGLFCIGCERPHPGNYAQPAIEAQVMKSLELTEIQISGDSISGYTGTGKSASGETYKLKISQDIGKKSLSWKAEGDRGDFRDGEYHFE